MNQLDDRVRVGIVGCGTIGSELAKFIDSDECRKAEVVSLYDLDQSRSLGLAEKLSATPKSVSCIREFFSELDVSLIIEAAGPDWIQSYSRDIVSSGKHLMVMSVGGLLHNDLYSDLDKLASASGSQILIPSGAIGGIDAIKACRSELDEVILTTTKHPDTLVDTLEYSKIRDIDKQYPKEIFYGPAIEAVSRFPFNINVAATISIAGIGPSRTMVRVVADTQVNGNVHEIYANGSSGVMRFRMENTPHPDNPRTSYMAVLAGIETIRYASNGGIRVGT
mgnify:CR=1 FL=1